MTVKIDGKEYKVSKHCKPGRHVKVYGKSIVPVEGRAKFIIGIWTGTELIRQYSGRIV